MDLFGAADSKKMPEHFFAGAMFVDHTTATRADIDSQDYTVCPRHWYVDAMFECEGCRQKFCWSAEEQRIWFEERRFWVDSQPRRCRKCRRELHRRAELQSEYDQTVAAVRVRGTRAQKARIVEIVAELERDAAFLPEKVLRTKADFEEALADDEPPGADDAGQIGTSTESTM